jgi:DNA-binding HxlR family transcriptional regulator
MTTHDAALVDLFHHRWAIPALAAMAARGGGRRAELTYRLGASRGALVQALDRLVSAGLVVRNRGHGHPLRSEYLLTEPGRRLARAAARFEECTASMGQCVIDAARRKWCMPVIHVLESPDARFSELRARLPGVTDRALSAALRQLESAALVERQVIPAAPPQVIYARTRAASELQAALKRLDR